MNRANLLKNVCLLRNLVNGRGSDKVVRPFCCACDKLYLTSAFPRISSLGLTHYASIRQQCTKAQMTVEDKMNKQQIDGLFSKKKKGLGKKDPGALPDVQLRRRTMVTFSSIIEQVDHDMWMKEFNLPDTFNSWFKITELHVWMMLLRFNNDENNPNISTCSNLLVNFMWDDAAARVKKLGYVNYAVKKDSMRILYEQFKAALLSYDEGILGDDRMLASAVWRTLLNKQSDPEPEQIELLVHYIRKQVHHLAEMDLEETLGILGFVPLLPLHGESLDKNTLTTYNRLVERFMR